MVADIGPDAAGIGLALGQDRHGSIVTVHPLGTQHMRFDWRMPQKTWRPSSVG